MECVSDRKKPLPGEASRAGRGWWVNAASRDDEWCWLYVEPDGVVTDESGRGAKVRKDDYMIAEGAMHYAGEHVVAGWVVWQMRKRF